MMKRVTWFAAGIAAGALGTDYAKRKVRATAAQYTPARVARGTVDLARQRALDVADALRDGRMAMRVREAELKARRDGRLVSLDEPVAPGEAVLVDGEPVAPGRVVLLRRASTG